MRVSLWYNFVISLLVVTLLSVSVSAFNWGNGTVQYWQLNEASGTNGVEFFNGINNLTHTNGPTVIGGVISNARNYSNAGDTYSETLGNTGINGDVAKSYCAWGKPSGTGRYLFAVGTTDVVYLGGDNKFYLGEGITDTGITYTHGTLYYICLTYNPTGTATKFYVNGVSAFNVSLSLNRVDTTLKIGTKNSKAAGNSFNGMIDEFGMWDRILTPTEITELYNSGSGLNPVPLTQPISHNVTLDYPANNSVISTSNPFFNATITANTVNTTIANATIFVWDITGTIVNSSSRSFSLGAGVNALERFNVTNLVPGIYRWNIQACATNSTAVICKQDNLNRTFTYAASVNSNVFNTTTYEGSTEAYTTNITVPSNTNLTTAILYYNGTAINGVNTSIGNDRILTASRSFNSTDIGEKNLFWSITFTNGFNYNLTVQNQNVSAITLGLCSATNPIPYINFTFKNETSAANIVNASIDVTFNYGFSSADKTTNFISATANRSDYGFCFSPQNRNIVSNITLTYSAPWSIQRSITLPQAGYTNTSTNFVFWLLPSGVGSYVTFQIVNNADQVISGALVNISRSGYGTIEARTTDDAGSATFFLDPTVSYTIIVSKEGYTTYTTTITPTQSSYTINLESQTVASYTDYIRGVIVSTYPLGSELNLSQSYVFGAIFNSTFWNLDSFGFNIYGNNGSNLGSASSSGQFGNVSTVVNTAGYKIIYMNYYWRLNGTTNNQSTYWYIYNMTDTDTSINNFFQRLSFYLGNSTDSDGIFGLKSTGGANFSLSLILFLVIFATVGIISYKYGLTSTTAIIALVFAAVYWLDLGVGIVPNPVGAVSHFPTIFLGIILFGSIIWEAFSNG